jgi:ankyrin repeat protein
MALSGRPPKIDPLKPIHKAVMYDDVPTFSVELARGDDIDAPGPEAMTPLHLAADKDRLEMARALLDAGAEIDPINVWGNTPLWVAIMAYDGTSGGALVDLLLTHGADPTRTEAANGVSPVLLVHRIAGLPQGLIDAIEQAAKK